MFEGFSPQTIDFLWGIRFNNNREWFQAHKDEYQRELYEPMQELVREVSRRYSLEGTIYKPARIYRDARYSSVPYKDHLWFCIREDNVFWSEHPSMYFQIEPEGGSCGFIMYAPPAQLMALHRKELQDHPKAFLSMLEGIQKSGRFTDRSARYKRPKPDGTPELEPWYQWKNCFFEDTIPAGEALFSKDLPQRLAEDFQALEPLYRYFRRLETMLTD